MPDDETPEFLAWTLAHPCVLKQFDGWEQPERAERHLRTARIYGEALLEGRCEGDTCYDRLDGPTAYFRISESMRLYGGAACVPSACYRCPANVLEQRRNGSLAGCYGEWANHAPAGKFYHQVDRAINDAELDAVIAGAFVSTSPRWYGLWMRPVDQNRAELLGRLFHYAGFNKNDAAWNLLTGALNVARSSQIPLIAHLYPRGRIAGRTWELMPHCPYCKHEIVDYRLACPCCGATKLPMPPLRRHIRGSRPWRPL